MDIVLDNADNLSVSESADLIGTFYQTESFNRVQSMLLKVLGMRGWKGFHFVDGIDGTTIVERGVDQYPTKPIEIIQKAPNTFNLTFIRPSLISVSLVHKNSTELKGKFSLKGVSIPILRFTLNQASTSPYFKKA